MLFVHAESSPGSVRSAATCTTQVQYYQIILLTSSVRCTGGWAVVLEVTKKDKSRLFKPSNTMAHIFEFKNGRYSLHFYGRNQKVITNNTISTVISQLISNQNQNYIILFSSTRHYNILQYTALQLNHI